MKRSGSSIEKPTDSKNRALVGMSGVHQVVNDLLSLDYSEMSIAKPHGVSSLVHDEYPAQRSSPLPRGRDAQLPSTTGAFAHLGDEIPADKLEERLVRHLRRWQPYVGRFGLLVLELHTSPARVDRANLDRTPAVAYDATHGFSGELTPRNWLIDAG